MSKNLVVKANTLINASYHLELIEQRLVLLAIVQSRQNRVSVSDKTKINIKISDYIDVFNVKGECGSVYQNLKSACKTLFERQFTYIEPKEKGVRVAVSRWVSEIGYNDEIATIDLIFSPAVVPLIAHLEKHFTSYELEQVANLKSKYAVRLYELVIAWRSKKCTPMINIEDLRKRLGVLENEYKMMTDFKKRVLDFSVKEINTKTALSVSYEQHKEGRKIVGFTFSLKMKKAKKSNDKKVNNSKNGAIKMSIKQASFFASKLSQLPECSRLPGGNQSYEALANWIESDLLKPERADFYRPLLERVGFKEKQ